MKIIEKMTEYIDDEICGIKDYAKMAIELKDEYPMVADTFYSLSMDEAKHMNMIHDAVVKVIERYRQQHGEPPADMMAVYNYMHKKNIEKYEEAKRYQEMYTR